MSIAASPEEIKAYYEQQKKEIATTFTAPRLGSEVTLRIASGSTRTGILMKLTDDSLSVLTDKGAVVYNRSMLHDSTCALFFAEDYAHEKALERTKEFRRQLQLDELAEYHADLHEGRIAVSAKAQKSSDKYVEEDERETNSGDTITTITTTRTFRETQKLTIRIANNTVHPDTYTLKWCFIGKSIPSDAQQVHDSGSKQVMVEGRNQKVESITSEPFIVERVEINRQNSGGNSGDARIMESGQEGNGWLVVLKYGNDVLDAKASSSSFLSEEWMNRLD